MRINVFEIEAILPICLYQKFSAFVISFGCDTFITISSFFVLIQLFGIFSDNV